MIEYQQSFRFIDLKGLSDIDFLVEYPSESFDSYLQFLSNAAQSTSVSEMYLTLYRIGNNPSIYYILRNAIQNGIKVHVNIELHASGEEELNKSWLYELKESPQFIKTTLFDVKKATSMITQKVEKIAEELEKEKNEQQDNKQGVKVEQPVSNAKIFYSSVAYLQSSDDTSRLDEFRDKGNYEGLLRTAKEYYDGNGINEQYTFSSPIRNKGDDLLVEDKDFAVVYNNSVGGTYEVMLKYSEQEIRNHIKRYGTRQASDDIKEVAKDMVNEEFAKMVKQRVPTIELPSGDTLYFAYNRENDSLDFGTTCNAGQTVSHSFPYDHDSSLDMNVQVANEKLNEMKDYQAQDVAYSYGMRR